MKQLEKEEKYKLKEEREKQMQVQNGSKKEYHIEKE